MNHEGLFEQVMPYLSRRATENRTVLGDGAALVELRRIGLEIRRRISRFGS